MILISGSGAQDRDETIFEHKPFLVLADMLTRRGVAVLRVDDRGVGGSSGSVAKSTSDDFAGDVQAGIALLKSRPDIDGRKIGLIGHSEGGIIAPIVAARSRDVAFIVLLAGTGLPGDEILMMQGRLIGKVMGANDKDLDKQKDVQKRLFEIMKTETDPKKAGTAMRAGAQETAWRAFARGAKGGRRHRFIRRDRDQEARVAVVPLLPDLRPAADAREGAVPGPGLERRKGLASAPQGKPRGDCEGDQEGGQHASDDQAASRVEPPVPDLQDRVGLGVRRDRGDDRPGCAQSDRGLGCRAIVSCQLNVVGRCRARTLRRERSSGRLVQVDQEVSRLVVDGADDRRTGGSEAILGDNRNRDRRPLVSTLAWARSTVLFGVCTTEIRYFPGGMPRPSGPGTSNLPVAGRRSRVRFVR